MNKYRGKRLDNGEFVIGELEYWVDYQLDFTKKLDIVIKNSEGEFKVDRYNVFELAGSDDNGNDVWVKKNCERRFEDYGNIDFGD